MIKKTLCSSLSAFAVLAMGFPATMSATTYTYNGPSLFGLADHLVVSFSTIAPLAANRSYLSLADAGVTSSSVAVVGPGGVLPNFNLPVNTFQIHTDRSGNIDAWFVFGGADTLVGTSPTMIGEDWQAYTINTMDFIVGSVTGNYMYDQATDITFYASCNGAPAGCTLAGNGQPYLSNYGGIINPSNTSAMSWSVPEPQTWAFMFTGLATVGAVVRRRSF